MSKASKNTCMQKYLVFVSAQRHVLMALFHNAG